MPQYDQDLVYQQLKDRHFYQSNLLLTSTMIPQLISFNRYQRVTYNYSHLYAPSSISENTHTVLL